MGKSLASRKALQIIKPAWKRPAEDLGRKFRVFYLVNDNPFGIDQEQREEQEEHQNSELTRLELRRSQEASLLLVDSV